MDGWMGGWTGGWIGALMGCPAFTECRDDLCNTSIERAFAREMVNLLVLIMRYPIRCRQLLLKSTSHSSVTSVSQHGNRAQGETAYGVVIRRR